MTLFHHCLKCTVLDGCYFVENNKPLQPLHNNCDCKNFSISIIKIKNKTIAEMSINKFTNYVFKDKTLSKGKVNVFKSWGYTINDSSILKNEFENQAKENYIKGLYK